MAHTPLRDSLRRKSRQTDQMESGIPILTETAPIARSSEHLLAFRGLISVKADSIFQCRNSLPSSHRKANIPCAFHQLLQMQTDNPAPIVPSAASQGHNATLDCRQEPRP